MSSLKSSPLYQLEHVHNRLKARGLGAGPLTVSQLIDCDELHYLGTDALDQAASKLDLSPDKHVLDIGSGLGGPARYLAFRYGCRVTGVEPSRRGRATPAGSSSAWVRARPSSSRDRASRRRRAEAVDRGAPRCDVPACSMFGPVALLLAGSRKPARADPRHRD